MMNRRIILSIISTICGIYVGFLTQRPVSSLCESERCPYCYGDNLCKDVEERRINLRHESFVEFFYNVLSVKNVYFGEYGGVKVVLKKLGHRDELEGVVASSPAVVDEESILKFLNRDSVRLKTCDEDASASFLRTIEADFGLEQTWTTLQINPEPLILTLFKSSDRWPVPELYGACGLVVVEKHCGRPLDHFESSDWYRRAFLASKLLEAAVNFTRKHEHFRLYLTDISTDNIAVDDDFNLCFVDLENVILKQKLDESTVHFSEHFEEDNFVYDEAAICESSISDHNIYGVCKLLLSRRAPWPMMRNGLLHSPPADVLFRYNELFALIEKCVDSKEKSSRFYIAEELIKLLNEVIR